VSPSISPSNLSLSSSTANNSAKENKIEYKETRMAEKGNEGRKFG